MRHVDETPPAGLTEGRVELRRKGSQGSGGGFLNFVKGVFGLGRM